MQSENTQVAVKDGENEELFKRMRALEEIVKNEREEEKEKERIKYALENRKKYHNAIATLCAKYRRLDRDVVGRLSNADKECLADSIEEVVEKKLRRQTLFAWLHFLIGAGAISSLGYFVHPGFFFIFIVFPLWAPLWASDTPTWQFLDYRKQTKKVDRVALEDGEA